jgi:hypothetical protein
MVEREMVANLTGFLIRNRASRCSVPCDSQAMAAL